MTQHVSSIWESQLFQTALENLEREHHAKLMAAVEALTSNEVVRVGWADGEMTVEAIPLSEFYRQA